jgi:hypothetical protein
MLSNEGRWITLRDLLKKGKEILGMGICGDHRGVSSQALPLRSHHRRSLKYGPILIVTPHTQHPLERHYWTDPRVTSQFGHERSEPFL